VCFQEEGGILEVSVRDNGSGFIVENNPNSMKQHKSVGMSITKRRLELLSDKKASQSIAVNNVYDAAGNTIGVLAKIRINIRTETTNSTQPNP